MNHLCVSINKERLQPGVFSWPKHQSSCCQLPLMLASSVSALAGSCLEREEEVRQRWFGAVHSCSNHENIQSGCKQQCVRKGWYCTDLQKYFALSFLLHFSRRMRFQSSIAHILFYWQNNVSYSIPRLIWFLMGQYHYLPKWIGRFCQSCQFYGHSTSWGWLENPSYTWLQENEVIELKFFWGTLIKVQKYDCLTTFTWHSSWFYLGSRRWFHTVKKCFY